VTEEVDGVPALRRVRALLLLGTLAGTLGAALGFRLGWTGFEDLDRLIPGRLDGPGLKGPAVVSFFAAIVSLGVAGLGLQRFRPFHAVKASPFIGGVFFAAGWGIGHVAAAAAGG
jgi:hypothetical protein